MTTINRLRQPPILIGGIVAGLLLLGVLGVVRNVGAVDGATVANAMQSNVGAAVGRPVAPTAIAGTWLKTQAAAGSRWVYADYWFDCRYVAADGSEYAIGAGYAVAGWPGNDQFRALAVNVRMEITEVCHE